MYSVPPGFSKLRLPLGDFVIYPTARPSIRTLVRQIDYQVYSVQTYLFPNNNLRAIPPGDRHWAVVIGDAILVIVPPFSSESSVDPKRISEESSDAFRGMHLHISSHLPTGPH